LNPFKLFYGAREGFIYLNPGVRAGLKARAAVFAEAGEIAPPKFGILRCDYKQF
jgi:hypothetical protein